MKNLVALAPTLGTISRPAYAVARKYLQANVSIEGKFEGLQRLLNQECNTSFESFP